MQELLPDAAKPKGESSGRPRNFFGGARNVRWPASPSVLADMIASALPQLSVAERQQVLDTASVKPRLQLVSDLVTKVLEVQQLSHQISSVNQKQTEDELRETVLKRQLAELQREMRRLQPSLSDDQDDASSTERVEKDGAGEELAMSQEDEEEDDVARLRLAVKDAQLSAEASKIAFRELKRLQTIQQSHPEYTVCRTYVETLCSLPWALSSGSQVDMGEARQILDSDHYGLEKVKRRILEFLAVQKMRGDMKGPILCLHGPPGVGKTSLGKSIAKALGRKFHRIALGGVRDEAEIRGHRRTYVGSMPGAIIQALISLKVNDPVMLLDEIDKLTRNAMFNPSGALLELLDPEQNHTFKDHYINTPFDLSQVLFLCTCNDLQTIDRPLLDRMEIIDLSGYTIEEKVHIATTHLLPKQCRLHALTQPQQDIFLEGETMSVQTDSNLESGHAAENVNSKRFLISLTDEALRELIAKWTEESGVRSLERRLAQLCRWAALRLTGMTPDKACLSDTNLLNCGPGPGPDGCIAIDSCHLPFILGSEKFEAALAERLTVGVALGLAVTQTGGQLLFVEASRNKGSGRLTVTGQLGEVMKESVTAALSLLRSKVYTMRSSLAQPVDLSGSLSDNAKGKFSEMLALITKEDHVCKDPFLGDDIHVHFPAGAIPKDGPSAGVASTIALASLLLQKPMRSDTGVTGEITLRGHVLPVGGIRDKVLAAHRAGLRHVLVPFGNQRQVDDEIPESARSSVSIHFVKDIEEVFDWAFSDGLELSMATSTFAASVQAHACQLISKL